MLSHMGNQLKSSAHQLRPLSNKPPRCLVGNQRLSLSAKIATTKRNVTANTRRRPQRPASPAVIYRRYRHLSEQHRPMSTSRSTDPLVWIDCEMTGLDYTKDQILSVSCFVTTHDLEMLDTKGYHATIHASKQMLDSMSPWCIETHGHTGLTQACLSSTTTAETAASGLLEYIQSHIPVARRALLAGNSVHADKMFLMQMPWTPVVEWLHYRLFDVSAIKEAARRWCSDEVLQDVPRKKLVHSAEDDIRESIEEARYYMKLFRGMGTSSTEGSR